MYYKITVSVRPKYEGSKKCVSASMFYAGLEPLSTLDMKAILKPHLPSSKYQLSVELIEGPVPEMEHSLSSMLSNPEY